MSKSIPAPDTVRSSIERGQPLILSLPETVGGSSVSRYTMLHGPALSGVAGRSFVWITESVAPGTHEVRLHAHRPEASPDTLVVQVDVQP